MKNMKNFISAPDSYLMSGGKNGEKSSKRFWGNRLLTVGVLLAVGLYASDFAAPLLIDRGIPKHIHKNMFDIITLFFYTGGGLLFGGVFENFGRKK